MTSLLLQNRSATMGGIKEVFDVSDKAYRKQAMNSQTTRFHRTLQVWLVDDHGGPSMVQKQRGGGEGVLRL